MYLGIDPGDTTGYAIFKSPEEFVEWGDIPYGNIEDWIANCEYKFDVIVVESFQLFQKKAVQQTGSKMKASQVFGMFKLYAKVSGATFVEQPPTIKAFAEKQSGLKPKGAHANSHRVDAANHLIYYFIKSGKMQVKTG